MSAYPVFAIISKPGIYVCDSTCFNCDSFLDGDPMSCKLKKNGEWFHHLINKSITFDNPVCAANDSDAVSESVFAWVDLSFNNHFMDKKFYVGAVITEYVGQIPVKLARKYFDGPATYHLLGQKKTTLSSLMMRVIML